MWLWLIKTPTLLCVSSGKRTSVSCVKVRHVTHPSTLHLNFPILLVLAPNIGNGRTSWGSEWSNVSVTPRKLDCYAPVRCSIQILSLFSDIIWSKAVVLRMSPELWFIFYFKQITKNLNNLIIRPIIHYAVAAGLFCVSVVKLLMFLRY